MNETKNIIPYELRENDNFINMVAVDLSRDFSPEADHYKEQIKNIVKLYYQGVTDTITALKQIHNVLINYDYTLTHSEVEKAFNCYLLLDIENSNDLEKEMLLMLFSSFCGHEIKDIISNYKHNALIAENALIALCNK